MMVDNETRAAIRRLLKRWGRTAQMCKGKQEEIERYNCLIDATYGLHAQQYSGMPHGGEVSNPTAMTAEQADKLREAYKGRIADIVEDIVELTEFCAAIDSLLLDLPEDQQRVIELRYKRFNSTRHNPWVRVARFANMSEATAKRAERNAVDTLSKEIDVKTVS